MQVEARGVVGPLPSAVVAPEPRAIGRAELVRTN